uniref:Putative ovule protein n=1 Tax=Solanum chacoense TaxID=4108 RepID=A0A0V0HKP5_SOLCH
MSFISLFGLLPLFESHYVRLLPQFQFVTVIRLFSKGQLKVPKRLITMSNTMNTAYTSHSSAGTPNFYTHIWHRAGYSFKRRCQRRPY